MLIVTTENIVGKEILEVKGLVRGSTVRSKHLGNDIAAAFKNLAGGELNSYNDMLTNSVKLRLDEWLKMLRQKEQMRLLGCD